MILDDLDFFILRKIFSEKETTSWTISKSYPWSDKKNFSNQYERDRFFETKASLICLRLKNFQKEGLIFITRNGDRKNVYNVDSKKILFCNQKCNIVNKIINTIQLISKDNKVIIFEI